MIQSDAGICHAQGTILPAAKGQAPKMTGERYNDNKTDMKESMVYDSEASKSTVYAKVPRSSINDIRLADILMQSGQRVLNGGMKSMSIQNIAEMKSQEANAIQSMHDMSLQNAAIMVDQSMNEKPSMANFSAQNVAEMGNMSIQNVAEMKEFSI